MPQVILVALPALWLALSLGTILYRELPALLLLLPQSALQVLTDNATHLFWVGPVVVLLGLLVLTLEVLRHWAGMVLDSILVLLGGLIWLTACLLSPSPLMQWLAVPVFTLLMAPAALSMVILTILAKDDTLDGTFLTFLIFMAAAVTLHVVAQGLPAWLF